MGTLLKDGTRLVIESDVSKTFHSVSFSTCQLKLVRRFDAGIASATAIFGLARLENAITRSVYSDGFRQQCLFIGIWDHIIDIYITALSATNTVVAAPLFLINDVSGDGGQLFALPIA